MADYTYGALPRGGWHLALNLYTLITMICSFWICHPSLCQGKWVSTKLKIELETPKTAVLVIWLWQKKSQGELFCNYINCWLFCYNLSQLWLFTNNLHLILNFFRVPLACTFYILTVCFASSLHFLPVYLIFHYYHFHLVCVCSFNCFHLFLVASKSQFSFLFFFYFYGCEFTSWRSWL